MTTYSRHPAFLSLQGGINFRDLGGVSTVDGRRLRQGKLLRSGSLHMLTAEDLEHLDTLPLTQIIDYRDPHEAQRSPDKLNDRASYLNAPANPLTPYVDAKVTELNAATLNAMNGEQFMLQLYRHLPFNNAAYHQLTGWLMQPFEGRCCSTARWGKTAPA